MEKILAKAYSIMADFTGEDKNLLKPKDFYPNNLWWGSSFVLMLVGVYVAFPNYALIVIISMCWFLVNGAFFRGNIEL